MANMKAAFSKEGMKKFFLKHTEKLVLGLVCLFILTTLAGTQWSSYKKPPGELVQALAQADRTIEGSAWPAPEQEKYPPLNVQQDVNQMLAEMSDRPWIFSTNIVGSVFGAEEPRREPEFFAVMDLRADGGRTILAQSTVTPATDPMNPEAAPTEPKPSEQPKVDIGLDDVAARPNTGALSPDGMGMGGPGGANPYGGGSYEQEMYVQNDPNAMIMDETMMAGGMGMDGMGMSLPSNVKGVPVKYISVRGVFDLRKQVTNYSKALNISETDAMRMVEFLDFKLERQVANSPQGPWDMEWEPVDIEVALDYLKQTVDFDADVVSVGVRNPVITMPLPARLIGVWRNKVNHPAVKNYELSEEEIEAEAALNREILDQARQQNKAIKQRIAPGGFAKQQLDVAQMQQDYFQQADARQLNTVLDDEFKGTPAEVRKKLIERIKAQVSASGNLVLFRYIDFDLQAGKSYRYRVSLVMRNPNYDQPVDRVVHPSVVEGETRQTPMSAPSTVATVSPDYAYFVKNVKAPRGVSSEQAELQIFQWYDEAGTMIKGTLSMEPGDYIGGKTKTHVLRPADFKYEEEDNVPFKTNDLLVDALVVNKLDPRIHNDLKWPRNVTRGELGIVPQVIVVDQDGKLDELDPVTLASNQQRYEEYYKAEKTPFDAIKDASKKMSQGSELDALLQGDPAMMEMEMMNGMMDGPTRLRGRKRNATRRGNPMMGSGMAPGMMP